MDGLTTFDALDKAANAFVKIYMSSGGNINEAVEAANKVLKTVPAGKNKQNEGDLVRMEEVRNN